MSDKNEKKHDTWAENFSKLITNFIWTFGWVIVILIIQDLRQFGKVSEDISTIFLVGAGIFAAIYAIKSCWYAVIAVLWPILVVLGLVGLSTAEQIGKGIKHIDDEGLKSVGDRIWYGKKGREKQD